MRNPMIPKEAKDLMDKFKDFNLEKLDLDGMLESLEQVQEDIKKIYKMAENFFTVAKTIHIEYTNIRTELKTIIEQNDKIITGNCQIIEELAQNG